MDQLIQKLNQKHDIKSAKTLLFECMDSTQLVNKAIDFIVMHHDGQFRKSGEPYAVHPILVAAIVASFGADEATALAALLHDVVEDTSCSTEEVREMFGDDVAKLVEGLTKIVKIREDQLPASSSNEKLLSSAFTFKKMLLVSIEDVRVLVIKLCDRLHNMLTLSALKPEKQKRISEETLVVYAPIAHRLGMSSIKNILEDLSFKYVLPEEYQKIDNYFTEFKQQFHLKLNSFIAKIQEIMIENGFIENDFEIHKRIKHYYSIYTKMQRKGITIEEVLDILAVRIIVKKPSDCYSVLGLVHLNFNPLISRFKDYIAIPKENGYQTIHTTVFDKKTIFEVQLRTFDMHLTAEYGIAAHWKYKNGDHDIDGLNPNIKWLNEISNTNIEKQDNDNGDNESIVEFYKIAKENLYSEDIAVYTPRGDIVTLPKGATALDFAYEVHTEVGLHAVEALVNHQKVPLLTELKNGDMIRIVSGKEPQYRCSWIDSVKTGKARSSILQSCRQKIRELDHKIAFRILLEVFHAPANKLAVWLRKENLTKRILKAATDSIYLQDIVNALKKYPNSDKLLYPILKIDKYKIKKQKFENIVVYSNHNISEIEFDYCCHPKRGDSIIGFKKGNSVVVHHKFCDTASKMIDSKDESMIFVKWTREAPKRYKLIISIENKKGALASFLLYLAKMQINLLTIGLGCLEEEHVDFFEMVVEIPESADSQTIRNNIKNRYKLIDFTSVDDAYKF